MDKPVLSGEFHKRHLKIFPLGGKVNTPGLGPEKVTRHGTNTPSTLEEMLLDPPTTSLTASVARPARCPVADVTAEEFAHTKDCATLSIISPKTETSPSREDVIKEIQTTRLMPGSMTVSSDTDYSVVDSLSAEVPVRSKPCTPLLDEELKVISHQWTDTGGIFCLQGSLPDPLASDSEAQRFKEESRAFGKAIVQYWRHCLQRSQEPVPDGPREPSPLWRFIQWLVVFILVPTAFVFRKRKNPIIPGVVAMVMFLPTSAEAKIAAKSPVLGSIVYMSVILFAILYTFGIKKILRLVRLIISRKTPHLDKRYQALGDELADFIAAARAELGLEHELGPEAGFDKDIPDVEIEGATSAMSSMSQSLKREHTTLILAAILALKCPPSMLFYYFVAYVYIFENERFKECLLSSILWLKVAYCTLFHRASTLALSLKQTLIVTSRLVLFLFCVFLTMYAGFIYSFIVTGCYLLYFGIQEKGCLEKDEEFLEPIPESLAVQIPIDYSGPIPLDDDSDEDSFSAWGVDSPECHVSIPVSSASSISQPADDYEEDDGISVITEPPEPEMPTSKDVMEGVLTLPKTMLVVTRKAAATGYDLYTSTTDPLSIQAERVFSKIPGGHFLSKACGTVLVFTLIRSYMSRRKTKEATFASRAFELVLMLSGIMASIRCAPLLEMFVTAVIDVFALNSPMKIGGQVIDSLFQMCGLTSDLGPESAEIDESSLKEPAAFEFLDGLMENATLTGSSVLARHMRRLFSPLIVQSMVTATTPKSRIRELMGVCEDLTSKRPFNLHAIVESTIFFLKWGLLAGSTGDISKSLRHLTDDQDANYALCKKFQRAFTSSNSQHLNGVTVLQAVNHAGTTRNKFREQLRFVKGKMKRDILVSKIEELDQMAKEFSQYGSSINTRTRPCAITVWGKPGTGKSLLENTIMTYCHKYIGLQTMVRGTRPAEQQRDELLNNETTYLSRDDPGNTVLKFRKTTESSSFIRFDNSQPVQLEKADLAEKKDQFFTGLFCFNSTNDPFCGTRGETIDIRSIIRRLGLVLYVDVDPEVYDSSINQVDSALAWAKYGKPEQGSIGGWIWFYECASTVNSADVSMADMHYLENKKYVGNEIWPVIKEHMNKHFTSQMRLESLRVNLDDFELCGHSLPANACSHCVRKEPTVISPEMQEVIDLRKSFAAFASSFDPLLVAYANPDGKTVTDPSPEDPYQIRPPEEHEPSKLPPEANDLAPESLDFSCDITPPAKPTYSPTQVLLASVVVFLHDKGCRPTIYLAVSSKPLVALVLLNCLLALAYGPTLMLGALFPLLLIYCQERFLRPYRAVLLAPITQLRTEIFNCAFWASAMGLSLVGIGVVSMRAFRDLTDYFSSGLGPEDGLDECRELFPETLKCPPSIAERKAEMDAPKDWSVLQTEPPGGPLTCGSTFDQLLPIVASNMAQILIFTTAGKSRAFQGVFVRPNLLVSSAHSFQKNADDEITFRVITRGREVDMTLDRTGYYINKNDLIFIPILKLNKRRDLIKHCQDVYNTKGLMGREVIYDNEDSVTPYCSEPLSIWAAESSYETPEGRKVIPSYQTMPTRVGKPGDCGGVLIQTNGPGCSILGIKTSGNFVVRSKAWNPGRSINSFAFFTIGDVIEAEHALRKRTSYLSSLEVTKILKTPRAAADLDPKIHPNNMVHFLDKETNLQVFGQVPTTSSPSSNTYPNPERSSSRVCFGPDMGWQISDMNESRALRKSVVLAGSKTDALIEVHLQQALDDFCVVIPEAIRNAQRKYPEIAFDQPLDIFDACNGIDGYSDGVDLSTSAGPLYNCSKSRFFVVENDKKLLRPENLEILNQAILAIESGEHPGSYAKATPKSEALPPTKSSSLARTFYAGDMNELIIEKMYMIHPMKIILASPDLFETVLGVDNLSAEWHKYMLPLTGEGKLTNTDFSSFDVTSQPQVRYTASKVLLRILEGVGTSPSSMRMAEYVTNLWCQGIVSFRGALVLLDNLFTSGNLVTALLNGIRGSLLKRYVFFLRNPTAPVGCFREFIVSRTLGDDDIFKEIPRSPWIWSLEMYRVQMERVGLLVTDATKSAELSYIPFSESVFLQTKTFWNEDIGMMVGVRGPKSTLKPFYYVTGKTTNLITYLRNLVESNLDQMLAHGREVYEWYVNRAKMFCFLANVPNDWMESLNYDDALASFIRQKNPEGLIFAKPEGVSSVSPFKEEYLSRKGECIPEIMTRIPSEMWGLGMEDGDEKDVQGGVEQEGMNMMSTAAETEVVNIPPPVEPARTENPHENEWMNTYVRIYQGTLTDRGFAGNALSSTEVTVVPAFDWYQSPVVRNKMKGKAYVNMGFEVLIRIVTSEGVYGAMIAEVNLAGGHRVVQTRPAFDATLAAAIASTKPHVIIDYQNQEEALIQVPAVMPTSGLIPGDEILMKQSSVTLRQLAPRRHALGNTTPVQFALYTRPINFTQSGVHYPSAETTFPKEYLSLYDPWTDLGPEGPEMDSHPKEAASTKLSALGDMLGTAGTFLGGGLFMIPSELAKLGGTTLRLMGYSRPIATPDTAMVPATTGSMINSDTDHINAKSLTLHRSQEVSIDPGAGGDFTPTDPLNIADMVSRWTIIDIGTISTNDARNHVLWQEWVTPFRVIPDGDNPNVFMVAQASEPLLFLMYFYGEIKYRFRFYPHSSMSAEVRLCYSPMNEVGSLLPETVQNITFNFREQTEFSAQIGWMTPMGLMEPLKNGIPTKTSIHSRETHNGKLTLLLDSPLIAMSQEESKVTFTVEMCVSRNSIYARPDSTLTDGLTVFDRPERTTSYRPVEPPGLGTYGALELGDPIVNNRCCDPSVTLNSGGSNPNSGGSNPQNDTVPPATAAPQAAPPTASTTDAPAFEPTDIPQSPFDLTAQPTGSEEPSATPTWDTNVLMRTETEAPSRWKFWGPSTEPVETSTPRTDTEAPAKAPAWYPDTGIPLNTGMPTLPPEATTVPSSVIGSDVPSGSPTKVPSSATAPAASLLPTAVPTEKLTTPPTGTPTIPPTKGPTMAPSAGPSKTPSVGPSAKPTDTPSAQPTPYRCESLCTWESPFWISGVQLTERVGRQIAIVGDGSDNQIITTTIPFYSSRGSETIEFIGAFAGVSSIEIGGPLNINEYDAGWIDYDDGTGLGNYMIVLGSEPANGMIPLEIVWHLSGSMKIEAVKFPYPSDLVATIIPSDGDHVMIGESGASWSASRIPTVTSDEYKGDLSLCTGINYFPLQALIEGAISFGGSNGNFEEPTTVVVLRNKLETGYGVGAGYVALQGKFIIGPRGPSPYDLGTDDDLGPEDGETVIFNVGSCGDYEQVSRVFTGEQVLTLRSLLKQLVPTALHYAPAGEVYHVRGSIYDIGDQRDHLTLWHYCNYKFYAKRGGTVKCFQTLNDAIVYVARANSSAHDGGFINHFYSGCEVADSRVNPVTTIKFPYQTPYKYVLADGTNNDFGTNQMFDLCVEPRGGHVTVREYSCIGEDFNFLYNLGGLVLQRGGS